MFPVRRELSIMLLNEITNHVFLYNMAKVASMSIYDALVAQKRTVHHFHNLDPNYLDHVMVRHDLINAAVERMHKNAIRRKLHEEGYGRFVKLLVPFRDPISRFVSNVYFSMHFVPKAIGGKKALQEASKVLDAIKWVEGLVLDSTSIELHTLYDQMRNLRVLHGNAEHPDLVRVRQVINARMPIHWFDYELKQYCGVDILAAPPFPAERATYPCQNALLVKVERLSDPQAADDIRRFVQMEQLEMPRSNTSDEHGSKEIYDQVKQVRFSKAFLDIFYRAPVFQHLYTEEEISGFYDRWLAR